MPTLHPAPAHPCAAIATLILDGVEFTVSPAQLALLDALKNAGADIALCPWPDQRQEGLLPVIAIGNVRFCLLDLLCAPSTRAAIELAGVAGFRDYRPETLVVFGVGGPDTETVQNLLKEVGGSELVAAALYAARAELEAARQSQGGRL